MGQYVNPGNRNFQISRNSEIYVDKSMLIEKTNAALDTEKRFICVSRPRRFGKTMAANMLAAYYGRNQDASPLFDDLVIATSKDYKLHLNQHDVIMLNIQTFLSRSANVTEMLDLLRKKVSEELMKAHPEIIYGQPEDFMEVMFDTFHHTQQPFVILLDEWDCLFREYKGDLEAQKEYLDFLRLWLKGQPYVGLAYMTGILPIKKYGSHSALNMFSEFSMTSPRQFINDFGFTASEVKALAHKYKVDFEEIKKWYNGYFTDREMPIYNPTAVVESLMSKEFESYWSNTETYEALKDYIKLDLGNLKEKVTELIADGEIKIEIRSFANDMTSIYAADDVLTLLVHLGYLTYNSAEQSVRIPNKEVKAEFIAAIKSLKWEHVAASLKEADTVLNGIWQIGRASCRERV